jgi:hypothetical protein
VKLRTNEVTLGQILQVTRIVRHFVNFVGLLTVERGVPTSTWHLDRLSPNPPRRRGASGPRSANEDEYRAELTALAGGPSMPAWVGCGPRLLRAPGD